MHQCENGYTRIANTLLEAILQISMSGACFRVLLWIVRNSYGYNRKITRPSSLRVMAKDIKMTPSSVWLAIQVLIENGIIIKNELGELRIDKEKISSVRETGRLQVLEKLDKSVRETGKSVRETGHPLIIKKDNLKDRERHMREFEQFWIAYPRHIAKDKAWESWQKKKPDIQACLKTLVWQSPIWAKGEVNFIPHPSTWLNQGRWADEPPHNTNPPVTVHHVVAHNQYNPWESDPSGILKGDK